MNVDKFGRHQNSLSREVLRGPKGEGFRLTTDGHYDMKNKRLCNVGDAADGSDSVNLNVLRSTTLACDTSGNLFDAQSKRITNVGTAVNDDDAVNRKFVLQEIGKLKLAVEQTIKALSSNVPNTYTAVYRDKRENE